MFVVKLMPHGTVWTMDARGLSDYVLHNRQISRIDYDGAQVVLRFDSGPPLSMDQKIAWVQSYLGITMGCCG